MSIFDMMNNDRPTGRKLICHLNKIVNKKAYSCDVYYDYDVLHYVGVVIKNDLKITEFKATTVEKIQNMFDEYMSNL